MVEADEKKVDEKQEARVLALRGTLSRYVKEMEMEPGWHRLLNGVVAYSDPACAASRANEDKYEKQDTKPDLGKNVIQLDFFFTYTGEETRTEETPVDKVKERADQYGTCPVMTSSETKAMRVVPVPSKGTASLKTVTEEIIRFSMENSSTDPCIFQGDSERAMRQILRSVQQVRTIMGLPCETRLTGSGQRASNGQAERAVQTVRKMANCLRSFAETNAHIQIDGSFHMYPWAFKHAAFLINRFRVLEKIGRTSHELESRTIRRCAPEESFRATDMVVAKGLPWSYSPQGILMRHGGQAQRYRQPTLEADATEEELKAISEAIAAGVVTPAPGLHGQPKTPAMAIGAPTTPAPMPSTPKAKRPAEEAVAEEPEEKRQDKTESPRKGQEKREAQRGRN